MSSRPYCCLCKYRRTDFKCKRECAACATCVKKRVIRAIRHFTLEVKCVNALCNETYDMDFLKDALSSKLYSKFCQLQEVKLAGIENLESCPHCGFVAELPKCVNTFKCLNRKCKKRTCRWCKKPAHILKGCVETPENVKARTFVDNEMTKALVRICFKCKAKYTVEFYLECTDIECSCGAIMCYLCQREIPNPRSSTSCAYNRCKIYPFGNDWECCFDQTFEAGLKAMKKVGEKLLRDPIEDLIQNFEEILGWTEPDDVKEFEKCFSEDDSDSLCLDFSIDDVDVEIYAGISSEFTAKTVVNQDCYFKHSNSEDRFENPRLLPVSGEPQKLPVKDNDKGYPKSCCVSTLLSLMFILFISKIIISCFYRS